MKLFSILFASLFLFSCGEKIVQSPTELETIERIDYTTFSINGYFPEFTEESGYNLIDIKVTRDSSKASPKRNIFHGIIKRLSLDSLQNVKASELLVKHEECVKSCLVVVKLEEKKILDSSRILRDSIKRDLDSGLISRLDAKVKMTSLNRSVKEKLMSLNAIFKVKDCMESCDKEFIASFSTLLNPEQLKRFNDWLFYNNLRRDKKRG